jgi:2,3-bisphosphoglycerate-independent phosphoglycerate mutase
MLNDDNTVCTAHTTNLVPFFVVGDKYKDAKLAQSGALCDVAPTLLAVMGLDIPEEMEGKSLIK